MLIYSIDTMTNNFPIQYYQYLDFDDVIQEILISYQKKYVYDSQITSNILDQCEIDIPRMCVVYNGTSYKNLYDFHQNMHSYCNIKYYATENLMMLLLMLCTQSTFYYSYKFVYDVCQSEIYAVLDNGDEPNIVIHENMDNIVIIFTKKYKIMDMNTTQITDIWETKIKIIINTIKNISPHDNDIYCYGHEFSIKISLQ